MWGATSGEQQLSLGGHENGDWFVAWSPSGDRLLTASGDHTVIIWDAGIGEQQLTFTGHEDEVFTADWSPDGSQVASNDTSSG